MKEIAAMSKSSLGIVAIAIGVILTVVAGTLRIIGAFKWERTSAIGWERYLINGGPPYTDVIEVLTVAIAVALVIGTAFFVWSEFEKKSKL